MIQDRDPDQHFLWIRIRLNHMDPTRSTVDPNSQPCCTMYLKERKRKMNYIFHFLFTSHLLNSSKFFSSSFYNRWEINNSTLLGVMNGGPFLNGWRGIFTALKSCTIPRYFFFNTWIHIEEGFIQKRRHKGRRCCLGEQNWFNSLPR